MDLFLLNIFLIIKGTRNAVITIWIVSMFLYNFAVSTSLKTDTSILFIKIIPKNVEVVKIISKSINLNLISLLNLWRIFKIIIKIFVAMSANINIGNKDPHKRGNLIWLSIIANVFCIKFKLKSKIISRVKNNNDITINQSLIIIWFRVAFSFPYFLCNKTIMKSANSVFKNTVIKNPNNAIFIEYLKYKIIGIQITAVIHKTINKNKNNNNKIIITLTT